ncbi:MAG: AAA family ATPase [Acidimicrobiia bacterium]|nr:AAA family ATPase [Acidimicrobiia bacterium]
MVPISLDGLGDRANLTGKGKTGVCYVDAMGAGGDREAVELPLHAWLSSHGLEAWFDALNAEGVEVRDLSHLTAEDLRDLGMPLGPRRRFLAAASDVASNAAQVDGLSGAERRVLTVAFFDLVGSTALSDRLDTESLREVIAQYQELVTHLVVENGGHVAKYLGDGTLAYFGWPDASIDQAVAAVRAAKRVVTEVPLLRVAGVDAVLNGRVGIATGEVIIGDIAGEKDAIVGRTANLAARLEGQAPSGGVAIEARTASLTGRRFELKSLGGAELKGLEEAVEILVVGEERSGLTRFAGATPSMLDPMVGRAAERSTIAAQWQAAVGGEGQACIISGEPGSGKSRILHDLADSIGEGSSAIAFQCAPEWSAVPLRPIVRWVEAESGCAISTDAEERVARVSSHLAAMGLDPQDVRFFLRLFPNTIDDDSVVDVAAGHERLIASLARSLAARTSGPMLLALEDAHWADPTTLELFRRIAKGVHRQSALVVITHRSDWGPPPLRANVLTTVELPPLDANAIRALAMSIDTSVEEALDEITEQSGGNPFYAREYTTFILWRRQTGATEVPFTLATSLLGQLDALGSSKRLAQVAAAIGRTFESDLLSAMIGVEPTETVALLEPLIQSRMILPGEAHGTYSFAHTLLRDAAYDSLLAADRRVLHGRVADAASSVGTMPHQVFAMHCSRANRQTEAMMAWRRAGEHALAAGASDEAVHNLNAALDALESCPEPVLRGGAERLEMLLQLAPAYMVVRGYASESARAAYREAADLALKVGDTASHFIAVWGGYYTTEVRADFHQSGSDIAELLAFDASSLRPDLAIQVDHAAATYFGAHGPLETAALHSRRMTESYDVELHHQHRYLFGAHDPGVCGNGQLGFHELLLGRPDTGLRFGLRAVRLAEALEHPPSMAIALMFDSWISVTGRFEDAIDRVNRAVDFCSRNDVAAVGMTVDLLRRALIEDPEARCEAMFERLEPMRSASVLGLFVPVFASLAAESATAAGQPKDALAMLEYAQFVSAETAQHTAMPSILRNRGGALLLDGDADGADRAFADSTRSAVDVNSSWDRLLTALEWVPQLRHRGQVARANQVLVNVEDIVDLQSTHPVFIALRSLQGL